MSERLTATLTASLPTAQPLHRAFTHLLTEWLPTMQDSLTHFLSGFELGACSYFAVAFIWFAFNRSQATPATAAPAITPAPTTAITETTTQPSAANKPESIAPAIVEAARSMPQPQPKQGVSRRSRLPSWMQPQRPSRQASGKRNLITNFDMPAHPSHNQGTASLAGSPHERLPDSTTRTVRARESGQRQVSVRQ